MTIARGASRSFHVRAQNDRTAIDTLKVRGVESGGTGYAVAYFRGTTNITTAVRAGTFTLAGLDPGESVVLRVRITAMSNSTRGSVRNLDVTVRSGSNPSVKDIVRARVTRS